MKDKTITVRVPDDLGHGVFIFHIKNYMKPEDMQGLREKIIGQINDGCLLLPSYIDLVYPRLYE